MCTLFEGELVTLELNKNQIQTLWLARAFMNIVSFIISTIKLIKQSFDVIFIKESNASCSYTRFVNLNCRAKRRRKDFVRNEMQPTQKKVLLLSCLTKQRNF
jgi:hypothetical protein